MQATHQNNYYDTDRQHSCIQTTLRPLTVDLLHATNRKRTRTLQHLQVLKIFVGVPRQTDINYCVTKPEVSPPGILFLVLDGFTLEFVTHFQCVYTAAQQMPTGLFQMTRRVARSFCDISFNLWSCTAVNFVSFCFPVASSIIIFFEYCIVCFSSASLFT